MVEQLAGVAFAATRSRNHKVKNAEFACTLGKGSIRRYVSPDH